MFFLDFARVLVASGVRLGRVWLARRTITDIAELADPNDVRSLSDAIAVSRAVIEAQKAAEKVAEQTFVDVVKANVGEHRVHYVNDRYIVVHVGERAIKLHVTVRA